MCEINKTAESQNSLIWNMKAEFSGWMFTPWLYSSLAPPGFNTAAWFDPPPNPFTLLPLLLISCCLLLLMSWSLCPAAGQKSTEAGVWLLINFWVAWGKTYSFLRLEAAQSNDFCCPLHLLSLHVCPSVRLRPRPLSLTLTGGATARCRDSGIIKDLITLITINTGHNTQFGAHFPFAVCLVSCNNNNRQKRCYYLLFVFYLTTLSIAQII
jgi:hypothetical protein